jgi:protein-tyrosine-phosphatase
MAAAIMNKLAIENGLDVRIESAGLFAAEGEPASPEAIEALKKYDIDLSDHRSQQITPELIEKSDLIITMTEAHKLVLQDVAKEKTVTVCELAGLDDEIDDPFGGDLEDYIETADKLYIALTQISDKLEEIQNNQSDDKKHE